MDRYYEIKAMKQEYAELLRFLEYTLHELPTGVLYGNDGACEDECADLMKKTYELEKLSKQLDCEDSKFIEICRWHYERYPHYISRHKHFGSYKNYIMKYNGPLNVQA